MLDRRLIVKGALIAAAGLFALGTGLSATAQEAEDESEGDDVGVIFDAAFAVFAGDDATEDEGTDDGTDDGTTVDGGTVSTGGEEGEISASSSVAVSDASGGDGNVAVPVP